MKNHPFDDDALKTLVYWMNERESIRRKKEEAEAMPWTKDAILAKYRFCNVDRNDDKVTEWIHLNWLHTHGGQPDLWFAMVVARLLNLPSSLSAVEKAVFKGGKVQWIYSKFLDILYEKRKNGPIFNGAYIVSTNGHSMDKVNYLGERVLTPLWEARAVVRPRPGDTLDAFHQKLMGFDGLGSFMAAQVVGDLKYDRASRLADAEDWATWAASGPGSRRGMRRLLGQEAEGGFPEVKWRAVMVRLYRYIHDEWPKNGVKVDTEKLTAQNLQNCLCEFDKYMRTLSGEGKPKQQYKPAPWRA